MRLVGLGAAGLAVGVVAAMAVPAVAEWTERGVSVVAAQSTSIRAASVAVVLDGSTPVIEVVAPDGGAPPAWYEVRRSGEVICSSRPGAGDAVLPGKCRDTGALAGQLVTYAVEAGVGSWTATAEESISIPLPTPVIAWADGTDNGVVGDGITSMTTPSILLTAPPTSGGHKVTIRIDGVPLTSGPIDVGSGGVVKYNVMLADGLAPGPHTITATASFGAIESRAATLPITVASPTRLTSVELVDGTSEFIGRDDNRGNIFGGDSMTVTFDRAIDPSSVCAGWDPTDVAALPVTVTVSRFAVFQGWKSVLTVAPDPDACDVGNTLNLGSLTINNPGPRDNGSTVSFGASTLELNPAGTALILTVDTAGSGLRYYLPRGYRSTFEPSAALLDDLGFPVTVDTVSTTTTF